jgi:hypothetical protein
MSDTMYYGQFQSEKIAAEFRIARQIVSEIGNFGINERQRWLIIHQLALELENPHEMREVIGLIKELKSDLFLSNTGEI